MRVPLSWLGEFLELTEEPESIAATLTSIGLKVDKIDRLGADVDGVIVAEVMEVVPHPNADKLVLVDLKTAGGEERRVVCGARNFGPGDKVPLIVPGGKLPGIEKFEAKKIRGELSDGMLCSERDLGMSESHAGILILPVEAEIGSDARQVIGLNDTILELEISPNRADEMSLLGVARELAIAYGVNLRLPESSVDEGEADVQTAVTVEIDDPSGCPRYVARVITGVTVGDSPAWVQSRLTAAGVRPVSNVVDATNYALLVTGHPLHAFDRSKVTESRIVVRRAAPGESLQTLDGQSRELGEDDLVIADSDRPLALAGVMGGLDSEVTAQTTELVLESAYFDPRSIFRTAKRHGLRSEASSRFERGVDPEAAPFAADYACRLITEWAGGTVLKGQVDVYPSPIAERRVSVRSDRTRLLLGTAVSDDEIESALEKLALNPRRSNGAIEVTIPPRRHDLVAEEDLIEEVARLVGYDTIPSTIPARGGRVGRLPHRDSKIRFLRRLLTGAGIHDAWTSILFGPDDLDRVGYPLDHPAREALRVANPLSADESLLRTTLIPGLLRSVAHNLAHRNTDIALFEVGRCFIPANDPLPTEPLRLGIAMAGVRNVEWHTAQRPVDFFDMKGAIEVLLSGFRINTARFVKIVDPILHPTRAAQITVDTVAVGLVGELSVEATGRYDFPYRVYIAEVELEPLFAAAGPPSTAVETGRFPASLLDLAVTVDDSVSADQILETAKATGGDLLEAVRLFDVYKGDQTGQGKKSIALALTFRSPERTLTDAETLAARDRIADSIVSAHGGRIRE